MNKHMLEYQGFSTPCPVFYNQFICKHQSAEENRHRNHVCLHSGTQKLQSSEKIQAKLVYYWPLHFLRTCDMHKEEKVHILFKDALNTFYLWLFDIENSVKDHSARHETAMPLHSLLFSISSKGYFICTIQQTG